MFKLGFIKSNGGTPPAPTFITIGTQKWNTKNLAAVVYRDSTPINYATNSIEWNIFNTLGEGCYASVNYDSANDAQYGLLYNGYAVQNIINGGLAPEGWHIPTIEEANALTTYLGGWPIAGGAVKETGTTRWASPNTGATNTSNFTDVGAGAINLNGNYNSLKLFSNHALYSNIGIDVPYFQTNNVNTNLLTPTIIGADGALEAGYSVRIIRNDSLNVGDLYGGGKIIQLEGDPLSSGFVVTIVLNDLTFVDSYGCVGININATTNGDFITNTELLNTNSCNLIAPYLRAPNYISYFNDWYIASVNQTQLILDQNAVTGISTSNTYWTSTEIDDNNAKSFVYNVGSAAWEETPLQKTNSFPFFIIRAQSL